MSDATDVYAADVIPQNLAIEAMRDSGYRNTAYAIAELVDNSVQAQAQDVQLFCVEELVQLEHRQRRQLSKIAVLDDGIGMDAETLRKALQFGNGTRLKDRSGIGRFGMGLPNSSIAQASRLDVWTWRNGPENALHTYIDVEEIAHGSLREVPLPQADALPVEWQNLSTAIGDTGTLVLWSDLSMGRLTWKGAKATLRNTSLLIGRTHRNFIHDSSLRVRMVTVLDDDVEEEFDVPINDPMYLMPSPNLPPPFDKEPMFEQALTEDVIIVLNGEEHTVSTRYSVARPATVEQANNDRGKTAYGRDADRNMGVSVMRAGRELILDRSWTIRYDPRERWWGCEVEFPPELDEIFGVTNNKQAATHFTELAELEWSDFLEGGETTIQEVKDRLDEEGDPRGVLLNLSETIKRNLKQLREKVKAQGKGNRGGSKQRHPEGDPTDKANEKWKDRDREKPLPDTDEKPSDDDVKNLDEDLQEDGRTDAEREDLIARVKSGDLKILFVDKELGSSGELFTIRPRGGATEVVFNRLHPAFETIFDTISMDEDLDSMSTTDLQNRLGAASSAVHILFAAWARMEREDAANQRTYERVREDWGKLARDFLEDSDR
ncbi:ATP-binding protein [Erythrobacter litoralis]|uniref:ATP-binding protein n=1 Tax=Erythrobacter litoralis TaxID=39960 RepID=UPI0024355388|nr:ATP-binding protein [Erythrobacter litoralis]MDG6079025.1 ATP-binding protein [Erythrobacter litoralis]